MMDYFFHGFTTLQLVILMIAAVLILSTAYLVNATYNPFLYFRF